MFFHLGGGWVKACSGLLYLLSNNLHTSKTHRTVAENSIHDKKD